MAFNQFDGTPRADGTGGDWVFVGLHVSVLRALVACGLTASRAEQLAREARQAGQLEVQVEGAGGVCLVRRMRGNHAELYRCRQSTAANDGSRGQELKRRPGGRNGSTDVQTAARKGVTSGNA